MRAKKPRSISKDRLTPAERLALARRVLNPGSTLEEAAAYFDVNETTAVKWARRYQKYGVEGLSVGFSPRPAPRSVLSRTAAQAVPKRELEVPSLAWLRPRIEVPADLTRSTFTGPEVQTMKAAAALDLAAARRSVSASNQFLAACSTIYNAAKLMLAHFGFRSSERMRHDSAIFAAVEAFGSGTELPQLAKQCRSLRERYQVVILSGVSEVTSEQANDALVIANSFYGEVAALLLQCVYVPVVTPEEVLPGKMRYDVNGSALTLPVPLLDTATSPTPGRWIALPARTRNEDAAHEGEVYEENFVVVDIHRALPYSDPCDYPEQPIDCLMHRHDQLHIVSALFGSWQEDFNSSTGAPFAFQLSSYLRDTGIHEVPGNNFTILGAVACVLRHRPVTMQAIKRRARSRDR